jgi:hypothetical protein
MEAAGGTWQRCKQQWCNTYGHRSVGNDKRATVEDARRKGWLLHRQLSHEATYNMLLLLRVYAGHAEAASSTSDEQQQPLLDQQQLQAADDDDDLGFCRVFDTLNDGAKYAEDRQVLQSMCTLVCVVE